jgi:hypothetical protein
VYRFEGLYLADTLTVSGARVELERCAISQVVVHEQATADTLALSAVDCLLRNIEVAGLAQLECCTVLAQIICETLRAVDCLFLGALSRHSDRPRPPHIQCLRYVRLPQEFLDAFEDLGTEESERRLGDLSERRLIQRYTTDMPVFFETELGAAGAGVLHPSTPVSISAGAEDGSELGAYHHQHLTLRVAAVLEKLAEFLPFGMEAVLIPDKRLTCAPPDTEQPQQT